MATARNVLGKLKSSDGRIRIKTLSGVSALVAVIALLVGVLPAIADHGGTHPRVAPELVQYGGGPGACAFVDSAAAYELHNNNPRGNRTFTGPDGTKIQIKVNGNTFGFEVLSPGMAVYDVVVNGGPFNNHYDYDGKRGLPVRDDSGLHAPLKDDGSLNNLSHINICYDESDLVLFVCGGEPVGALRFGDQGEFIGATAQIFTVDGNPDCEKLGLFFIEGGETTLDFGIGDGEVAGRADFFKQFDSVDDFAPLTYDGGSAEGFEPVPWCTTEGTVHGDEFGVEWNPGIPGGHTACKVFETVYADATQHTVVYFEFEDPNFK